MISGKRWVTLAVAVTLGMAGTLALPHRAFAAPPVNVILDTDNGPDCDDTVAVALLHGLADRGEVNILGEMYCLSSPEGAPCLDALNTYYGRPNIPVGTLKEPGFLVGPFFTREIIARYPHRLRSGADAPDATELYRQILARQPDRSVVVVAIGPERNLKNLLHSAPDHYSPLDGRALVAQKVASLVCMGGAYPEGKEWNLQMDGSAAQAVAQEWPTPILYSGAEIGGGIYTGSRIFAATPEYNPVCMVFANYSGAGFGGDRSSWDPTAALAAVRGPADYWNLGPAGTSSVSADGSDVWWTSADGRQRYLMPRMSNEGISEAIEDLVIHARPGPLDFDFNTAYYARYGMGTVRARGEAAPNLAAAGAFDHDSRTKWLDNARSSWIEYDYADGKKYAVSRYALTSADDAPENDPTGWTLFGSNDGITWTALDSHKEERFTARSQRREFTLQRPGAYNRYRLELTSEHSVQLAEIELLEHISSAKGVTVRTAQLDHRALILDVAGRATVNITLTPINAENRDVIWTSDNPSVVTVKRIGERAAVVSGRGAGVCTVHAVMADGHRVASCRVTVRPSTLPEPWRFEDVNAPDVPGCADFRDGQFTVVGGGREIWKWQYRILDQFGYVSQDLDGDGVMVTRLTSQTAPGKMAKAGLMFRETVEGGSRHVMLAYTPTEGLTLQWRDRAGDDCGQSHLTSAPIPLPVYLRLERRGNTFLASASRDGKDWSLATGSHTCPLNLRLRIGLAVNGNNPLTTGVATFDHTEVHH
jgi:hypothetical protein